MLVGVLESEQVVSPALKPLPEIDTLPPAPMEVGLSVIVGAALVRVNGADIDGPGTTLGLVKIT